MSEKTWNINGKHFKFDFGDLECANRYDAACREMKRRSETVAESRRSSCSYRTVRRSRIGLLLISPRN